MMLENTFAIIAIFPWANGTIIHWHLILRIFLEAALGHPRHIQISSETAGYLAKAGKDKWCQKRSDTVVAKGKGKLTTYWLVPKHRTSKIAESELNQSMYYEELHGLSERGEDTENLGNDAHTVSSIDDSAGLVKEWKNSFHDPRKNSMSRSTSTSSIDEEESIHDNEAGA